MRLFLGLLWCRLLAVARAQAAILVIPGSAELIPVSDALNSRLAMLREFNFNHLIYVGLLGAKKLFRGSNRKNSRLNSRQTGKPRMSRPAEMRVVSTGIPGLISDCRAGWPAAVIGAVEPVAGNLDQLDGPPRALLDQFVPYLGERLHGLRRQAWMFDIDRIRLPLMVEARRIHRLLRPHAVIDDIHDRLEHRRNDARAPGAAEDEENPTVLFEQTRSHRGKRPFAGRDRVDLALDEAVEVRRPWL